MKIVFKVFAAIIYFNSVAPAFMYYIYDENPNAGYIAAVSGKGPYKNRMNSRKKYFIGSNNQKYMKLVNERAIDSHFSVLKAPSKPYVTGENQNHLDQSQLQRNAANSNQKTNIREDIYAKYGEGEVNSSNKDNSDITYLDKEKTTPADNQAYVANNVHNYNQREYIMNGEMYDKKPINVAVNGQRAPISNQEQKITKTYSHQYARQPPSYHQKMSVTGMKEKILHKASTSDHVQSLSRNNDMSQKQSVVNMQNIDSKKRETSNTKPKPDAPNKYTKTISISDDVRRYMREMNNHNIYKNNVVPSRIGNHEELVDVNETPYALFYRTNPEHLDEQEVLIGNPLVEPSNSAFDDKMTWNIENQNDPDKTESKTTPNIKLHDIVKNHASYRNR